MAKLKSKAERKMGRPVGAVGSETRKRILDAAIRCFGQRGYDLATNAEIAQSAGISAAAIYKHFEHKLDLYHQAYLEAQGRLMNRFLSAAAQVAQSDQAGTMAATILSVYRSSADMMEEDEELVSFLLGVLVEVRRHEEIGQLIRSQNDVPDLFEGWIRSGVGLPEDVSTEEIQARMFAVLGVLVGFGAITLMAEQINMHQLIDVLAPSLQSFSQQKHESESR